MTAIESSLPFEVEKELLDSIHGSLKSLAPGTFGVAAVLLVCGYVSRNDALRWSSAIAFLLAAHRFLVTVAYHRAARELTPRTLRFWKNRTFAALTLLAASLGLCGFIGVSESSDVAVNVPLVIAVIGYAASSASRNAGFPTCVASQLFLIGVSLVTAFVLVGGPANLAVAALLFAAAFAMNDISRSAYRTLVAALTYGRDKSALASALAEQAANFEAALSNMSHGLAMFDANARLVICNRRFAEFLRLDDPSCANGASPLKIINCAARFGLLPLDDVEQIRQRFASGIRCRMQDEMTLVLRNGRILELSFQSMAHGGAVVIVDDVTVQKSQEERIAYMARFDKLTGLPNRAQFEEKFLEVRASSKLTGKPFAVVCIDLDHFKEVNDTLTHIVGDKLLVAVAARMRAGLRVRDHIARFGGDEFVLILPGLDEKAAVAEVSASLRRLVEAVAEPYEIESDTIVIGMSAGVAIAPVDGDARDDILRAADLALYKAKSRGGGGFHFFEAGLDAAAQQRRQIILDMRKALAEQQFFLEYQPIVDLGAGRIASCEALLRWRHPTLAISPEKFIAMAEETGMIAELGRWALRQACRDAAAWPQPVPVAVNLSPVQFKRDDVLAAIRLALDETGLDPRRLELEITENLLISGDETTRKVVDGIVGLGCGLALDDFGQGYSTFGCLTSFPFTKVKLDKAFIDNIERRADHRAIIKAIRELASNLSMQIVAEGVETVAQLDILVGENVQFAQGWLFSRSVATGDIPWTKFRKKRSARAA